MTKRRPLKAPLTMKDAPKLVDELWRTRKERLDLSKKVEDLQKKESELRLSILDVLGKSRASAVGGKLARAEMEPKTIPVIKDWDALYQHIGKTKSFDLLQRRIAESAVRERWENKKEVPGIAAEVVAVLGLHKV